MKREEQDWWQNTNDEETFTKTQYQHALRPCILNRNANFNPNMIQVTGKVTPNAHTLLSSVDGALTSLDGALTSLDGPLSSVHRR